MQSRDTEREQVTNGFCANVALGALCETVMELPGIRPSLRVEEVVSSNAPPTACCGLARVTSCDLVLDEDDIFALSLHWTKYHSLDKIS